MDISTELADRVMRLVVSADYRPSKPKQIATALKLGLDEYRELRRVIKQLVLEGRLLYGSNHLVVSVGAIGGPNDSLRGTFRRAMGGDFGPEVVIPAAVHVVKKTKDILSTAIAIPIFLKRSLKDYKTIADKIHNLIN